MRRQYIERNSDSRRGDAVDLLEIMTFTLEANFSDNVTLQAELEDGDVIDMMASQIGGC